MPKQSDTININNQTYPKPASVEYGLYHYALTCSKCDKRFEWDKGMLALEQEYAEHYDKSHG